MRGPALFLSVIIPPSVTTPRREERYARYTIRSAQRRRDE